MTRTCRTAASLYARWGALCLALPLAFLSACSALVDAECRDDLALCSRSCVDTRVDRRNCGGCGIVCSADQTCRSGMCVAPLVDGGGMDASTLADAGVTPIDIDAEPLDDGGMRMRYDGRKPDGAYDDGEVPPDEGVPDVDAFVPSDDAGISEVDAGPSDMDSGSPDDAAVPVDAADVDAFVGADAGPPRCDIGEIRCLGVCLNPTSDARNCGMCGRVCGPTELCAMGSCVSSCPTGYSTCGDACVDLQNDPDHCGSCTRTCPSGICSDADCSFGTVGHVAVIGHDYTISRAVMDRVVGNAVFLAPVAHPRVLVYEGSVSAASRLGVDNGISSLGRMWTRTVSPADEVPLRLADADVFLIYPQFSGTNTALRQLGSDWRTALASFVNRGGVIVLLDTPTASHAGTWQILDEAGLFSASGLTDVSNTSVDVVAPSDALAIGVTSRYRGELDTVAFTTSSSTVVVRSASGPVVVHRVISP